MICVSIREGSAEDIFAILERPEVEMAEIRLDLCPLSEDDIEELFACVDKPLVATCRAGGGISPATAAKRLARAVKAGASYVDIEIEASPKTGKEICRLAREEGTTVIRSFHDFEGTPSAEELGEMLERCRRFGGEVAKIVTTARSEEDIERVQALYKSCEEGSLIAFCMGELGRRSRMECLALGAPFSYACFGEGTETAAGQIPFYEMATKLYGAMPLLSTDVLPMPASKSFAQRAILTAALAEGSSRLGCYTPCDDSEAAIGVAKALGAKVEKKGDELHITGIGPITEPLRLDGLEVGESGLLARLCVPVAAMVNGEDLRLSGRGTLLKRPLEGANEIMSSFGVVLSPENAEASRKGPCLPLKICGRLLPGRANISGKGGSQLISGLLTALPLAPSGSLINVREPKSIPYMFITLDVLRKFGVSVGSEMEGDEEFAETGDWSLCTGVSFKIPGGKSYKAADFDIEGDWSGAVPFLVAGAVFGGATLSGLDTSSLQADLSIVDILVEAGASVSQDDDGTVNVAKAPLKAFETDLNNAPDLFPGVAMLACFCPGTSRIAGVGRLAGKESDRASALKETLERMGVEVEIEGDVMVIEGHSLSRRLGSGKMLRGGSYTSRHDHRMVMALKVAELGADSPVEIDDTACVSKSFPGFAELWERFTGSF